MPQPIPAPPRAGRADASPALAPTLAAVVGRVDYLRAATETPADEPWIGCADLLAGGSLLVDLLTSTGAGRGTRDAAVAASLFVQGYAFRVPAIALVADALGLAGPNLDPAVTAIRISRHRPGAIAYLDPVARERDATQLARDVLGHLELLVEATRREVTIGERLLWGNVATSCAVAYRAVEGTAATDAERATIRGRADAFFAAAAPWLGEPGALGGFVTLAGPARDGWFWARTNCCLWYQATADGAGGSYCDDCSLVDPAERLARWQAEVDGPTDGPTDDTTDDTTDGTDA